MVEGAGGAGAAGRRRGGGALGPFGPLALPTAELTSKLDISPAALLSMHGETASGVGTCKRR